MVKKINAVIENEVIETIAENKSGFRSMTLEQIIDSICEQLRDSGNGDDEDIAISIYLIQPGKSKKRIFLYGQSQFVINAAQYCENNNNIIDILIENLQNFSGKEIEIETHIKCAALDLKTSKREIICIPELKAETKTETVMFEKIITERERKIEELESELKQKNELLQKKEIELTIERKNTEMLILKQSNQMPAGVTMRDIMEMQGRNRGGDNGQLNFIKSQYEMQINNINNDKRELRAKINELEKKVEELRNENIDLKLELNAMEYSTEGNSVMDSVDKILERVSPILPMLLGIKNAPQLAQPKAAAENPQQQTPSGAAEPPKQTAENNNEIIIDGILNGEYRSYIEMTLFSLKELFEQNLPVSEIQASFIEPYKDIYEKNIRPYLQYRAFMIPKLCLFAEKNCNYTQANIEKLKEFIETLR